MDKNEKIGLAMIGVSVLCAGAIIGGVITNKMNSKFERRSTNRWMDLSETFKNLLLSSYEQNDKLRKELEKLKA